MINSNQLSNYLTFASIGLGSLEFALLFSGDLEIANFKFQIGDLELEWTFHKAKALRASRSAEPRVSNRQRELLELFETVQMSNSSKCRP